MNVNMVGRAVAVAAVAIGLGIGVGHAALGDQGGKTPRVTATPSPTPGPSPKPPAKPATRPVKPSRSATAPTAADGAAAANRAAGWAVITPGTPAARYWGTHGVGVEDGYKLCEAALRVQFVRGYADPGADDSRQPLWKFECGSVTDGERDSILQAAVEWGATHEEGDG